MTAGATLASTTIQPDGNQTVGIASKNAKCPFLCVRPSKPLSPAPRGEHKDIFCLDERPQSKADSTAKKEAVKV